MPALSKSLIKTSSKIIEPIRNAKEIGALIRRTRREHGITQKYLAGTADVSERFLVELEDGRTSTEINKVFNLLDLLSIRLSINKQPANQFSSTIKVQRKANKINQQDLADLLGISLSTIQKIESGKKGVSLVKLFTVSQGLSIPWISERGKARG